MKTAILAPGRAAGFRPQVITLDASVDSLDAFRSEREAVTSTGLVAVSRQVPRHRSSLRHRFRLGAVLGVATAGVVSGGLCGLAIVALIDGGSIALP